MYRNIYLTLLLSSLLLVSCGQIKKDEDYLITIETPMGNMKVILYDETPLHKANFVKLAQSGQYDGSKWHRVIKEFMVQGGNVCETAGKGEDENSRIPAEIIPGMLHTKGALAAARQGDQINPSKKSSGCQFYIVHGRTYTERELTIDQFRLNMELSRMFQGNEYDSLKMLFVEAQQKGASGAQLNELALSLTEWVEKNRSVSLRKDISPERLHAYTSLGGSPHLDNEYSIFGKVVEGLDVIDKIADVKTGPQDVPIESVTMKMKVEVVKKKMITEKYGYKYPVK